MIATTPSRPRRRRHPPYQQRWALLIAVALVACLPPLLFGGALGWSRVVIIALTGIAAAVLASSHGLAATQFVRAPLSVLVLGTALTLFQALPLPRGWVAQIHPAALAEMDASSALTGAERPELVALSLAPVETWVRAWDGVALLAATAIGATAAQAGARRTVVSVLAAGCLAVFAVSWAHLVLNAQRVYGVYTPMHVPSATIGPILNPNHLGAVGAFGLPLVLGLGLEEQHGAARSSWFVAALVLAAGALSTLSRGAFVSVAVGPLVLGALWVARDWSHWSRSARLRAIGLIAGGAITLAVLFGLAVSILPREGYDKLGLIRSSLAFALEAPLLGIGRGAFAAAYAREHGTLVRFEHPENIAAQWTAEWGAAFALVTLVTLAHAWLGAARRAVSVANMGALAALATLASHDLFDFSLEMMGIAIPAALCLGAATAERARAQGTSRAPLVVLGVGGIAAAALAWTPAVELGTASLRQRLLSCRDEPEVFWPLLRQSVSQHPSEPVFPLIAASVARANAQRETPRWLNRAMVLAEHWSAPHLEATRWLLSVGAREQAMLELRETEERWPGATGRLSCSLARQEWPAELLLSGAPRRPSSARVAYLEHLNRCSDPHGLLSTRIDEALGAEGGVAAHARRARRALARDDVRAAETEAEAALARDGRSAEAWLLRAEVARSQGRQASIAILERALASEVTDLRVLRVLATDYAEADDERGMRTMLDRLRARAVGSAEETAEVLVLESQLELRRGNHGRAYAALAAAARMDPGTRALTQLAELSERLGDRPRALAAHRELCMRAASGSPHCAAADRLRDAMLASRPSD